jgi:membrane protein implicated in regulation of membrane protease activity
MKEIRDSQGVLVTVDIWLTTLYLSPAILILATTLKPHPKLYFFPLFTFFYTAFVYFAPLLGYKVDFLRFNSWMAIVAAIISAVLYMLLLRYVRYHTLEENSNDLMLQDMKQEYDKLRKENHELKIKLNTPSKN